MLDEGVCAEVKVGSEHLRLFSEQNAQGVQASDIEKLPSTVQLADSCDSRRRCLGCPLCFFSYVLECTTILAAYTLAWNSDYDVR